MNWKKSLPNGMRDRLFREAYGSEILEQQITELLNARGYQRIETPSIEFEDVFNMVENEGELYQFYDGQGRKEVLRPDVTLPIGRVVATTGVQLPLKLAYSGKIFRGNRELEGERNELTQVGIELIGYASEKAELECVLCSYEVMKAMRIPDVHFELGDAAILPVIEEELQFSGAEKKHFRQVLNKKNISEMAAFVAQHPSRYQEFLKELPTMFGPINTTIARAKENIPEDSRIRGLLDRLQFLAKNLSAAAEGLSITVDLGMVAKKEYYTGLIFNAYGADISEDFLSGGRYDRLLEKFDMPPTPAVGVALNLDAIIEAQYELGILPKQPLVKQLIFAPVEYFAQAQELVTAEVQLSLFDTLEATLEYAKNWQIPEVLIIDETGTKAIKAGE